LKGGRIGDAAWNAVYLVLTFRTWFEEQVLQVLMLLLQSLVLLLEERDAEELVLVIPVLLCCY